MITIKIKLLYEYFKIKNATIANFFDMTLLFVWHMACISHYLRYNEVY